MSDAPPENLPRCKCGNPVTISASWSTGFVHEGKRWHYTCADDAGIPRPLTQDQQAILALTKRVNYLLDELRVIACISPDLDEDDDDSWAEEYEECLRSAKRVANRAIHHATKGNE